MKLLVSDTIRKIWISSDKWSIKSRYFQFGNACSLLNYVCVRELFAQRPFEPIAWIILAWAYCIARRAQSKKSSSLSSHGISFDVPPPPELGATLVAPFSPARKTHRPLSKTSLNPNRSLDKNLSFSNDRFGFIEWLLLCCRTGWYVQVPDRLSQA